jgi:hypothetical protein
MKKFEITTKALGLICIWFRTRGWYWNFHFFPRDKSAWRFSYKSFEMGCNNFIEISLGPLLFICLVDDALPNL